MGTRLNDLIYRQDAVEAADAVWSVTGDANVAKVWDQLNHLPSAQPERIRGRWVKDEEASNQHVEPIYICSACNNMDAWGEVEKNTFKFCPNCGADMRGEELDETD